MENNEENVVQIENVDYKIDENGNAIDSEGKVFKTKEELDTLYEEHKPKEETEEEKAARLEAEKKAKEEAEKEDEISISSIIEKTGLKINDEDGNPVVFENNKDDIIKYIEKVYDKGAQDKALSLYEKKLASNPLIKDAVNFITIHGNLEGFNNDNSLATIKLEKDNEDALISVIRKSRKLKGDSEAEINNYISWAKSDGKLLETAKTSQTYIKQVASKEVEAREQQALSIEKKQQEDRLNYVNSVKSIVTSGTFKIGESSMNIPKLLTVKNGEDTIQVDRNAIVDYMTIPKQFKVGEKIITATQYEVDKHNYNIKYGVQNNVLEAIKLFTKSDDGDIVKAAVRSEQTDNTRKRILRLKTTTNHNRQTQGQIKSRFNR